MRLTAQDTDLISIALRDLAKKLGRDSGTSEIDQLALGMAFSRAGYLAATFAIASTATVTTRKGDE